MEPLGFELHVGPLGAGQLLQRCPAHHRGAVPVTPALMQQGGGRLNQPLPNACRISVPIANNRTPHGFQRLVGGPIVAGVKKLAGARDGRLTVCGSHGRSRAVEGGGRRWSCASAFARPSPPSTPLPPPRFNRITPPLHELIVPTHTAARPPVSPAARTVASSAHTA